jgi:hypothetical protein
MTDFQHHLERSLEQQLVCLAYLIEAFNIELRSSWRISSTIWSGVWSARRRGTSSSSWFVLLI